jgi:cysteinyl-tRNA synthetase
MSLKYLDGPFDIHTGGVDHRQLHHPNEIAQNQGYLGDSETGANYWLHAEFLIMRDTKMSKSSGEFWRLRKLVDAGVHPLVYRFFLLQAHYRSQVDFTMESVANSRTGYERILRRVQHLLAETGPDGDRLRRLSRDARSTTGGSLGYLRSVFEDDLSSGARHYVREFDRAVSDDLSTPKALALLSSLVADREIGSLEALRVIATMDLVLGLELLTREPHTLMIRPAGAVLSDEEVNRLVAERTAARTARDFGEADRVRDRLAEHGVVLEDGPEGTTWSWRVG